MPKRGGNISLTSYDDIFETDESRAESQLERVQNISISELVPFKDHPFKVVDGRYRQVQKSRGTQESQQESIAIGEHRLKSNQITNKRMEIQWRRRN